MFETFRYGYTLDINIDVDKKVDVFTHGLYWCL